MAGVGRGGLAAACRHAVPLGERRIRLFRRFSRRTFLAQAEGAAARTAGRQCGGADVPCTEWCGYHRGALGCVLPILSIDSGSEVGVCLSVGLVLFAAGRALGRSRGADVRRTCRQAGGWCAKPRRQRGPVWPQLGLPRRLAVPAFRTVLLSRDRLGDRAWTETCRGRRAGSPQDSAW